jgi:hypothetical protein
VQQGLPAARPSPAEYTYRAEVVLWHGRGRAEDRRLSVLCRCRRLQPGKHVRERPVVLYEPDRQCSPFVQHDAACSESYQPIEDDLTRQPRNTPDCSRLCSSPEGSRGGEVLVENLTESIDDLSTEPTLATRLPQAPTTGVDQTTS